MSKELESLKNIRRKLARYYNIDNIYEWSDIEDDLEIIEKALKENAELKQMIRNFNEAIGEPQIIPPSVEKKLKALEIIKRKKVNMQLLIESPDLDFYNSHWFMRLYQEEFKLLKEVLK